MRTFFTYFVFGLFVLLGGLLPMTVGQAVPLPESASPAADVPVTPPEAEVPTKPAAMYVQSPPQTVEMLRAKLNGLCLPDGFRHEQAPLDPNGKVSGVILGSNELEIVYSVTPTGNSNLAPGQTYFSSEAAELRSAEHKWSREQYIGDEFVQLTLAADDTLVISYPGRGINMVAHVNGLEQLTDAMLVALSIPNRTRRTSWDEAKKLIETGNVQSVTQYHSGIVKIRLADETEVTTQQPSVDDVIKLIRSLGKEDEIGIITE